MPTAPIKGGKADRKPRDNDRHDNDRHSGKAARIGNAAPGPAPHRGRNGGNGPPHEDERG